MSDRLLACWGDGNRFDPDDSDIEKKFRLTMKPIEYHNYRRHCFYYDQYQFKEVDPPTMRYSIDMQIGDITYIIQFNSIDFLNGLTTINCWQSNDMCNQSYLYNVYDNSQLCYKKTTYLTPFHRYITAVQRINGVFLIYQIISCLS